MREHWATLRRRRGTGSRPSEATWQGSIRINDQWRVVFRWGPAGPVDVDIRDYH